MDAKSKIILFVFLFLLIGSIVASYYRYMVKHDYFIDAEIDCDPYTESCFVWECDPSIEGECTGNEEEDIWYYKLLKRNAMNMQDCNPLNEGCDAFICNENEKDCEVTNCSTDILVNLEKEGICTDPVQYTEEHPIEEGGVIEETADVLEQDGVSLEETSSQESVVETSENLEAPSQESLKQEVEEESEPAPFLLNGKPFNTSIAQ